MTILNNTVQDTLFTCTHNRICMKTNVKKTVRYQTRTTNVLFCTKITISTLTKEISWAGRERNEVLQTVKGK